MTQLEEKVAGAGTLTTREDSEHCNYQNHVQSTASRQIVRLTIRNREMPGRPLKAVRYYDGHASLTLGDDPLTSVLIVLNPAEVAQLARLFGGDPQ